MVLNANFNNISVIPWQAWSVLLVEETGVPGETIDLPQQLQDKNRKFGSCIVIKLIYPCTLHKSNIRLIRSKFMTYYFLLLHRNINRLTFTYCTSILS
jgi:hypothetical protein